MSASFSVGTASGSYHFDRDYQFKETDLNWALVTESNFGRFIPAAAHLPQKYLDLARRNEAGFIERCGHEYVSQERKTARVAAIFSVHDLTEAEKTHMQASFSASGWGASLAASAEEMKKKLRRSQEVRINVIAIGGKGLAGFSDLATVDVVFSPTGALDTATTEALKKVQEVVQKYLAEMTIENAASAEFTTTPWTALGVPITGRLREQDTRIRDLHLRDLLFDFFDLEDTFVFLSNQLRAAPDMNIATMALNDGKIEFGQLSTLVEDKRALALTCLTTARCAVQAPEPYKLRWKPPAITMVEEWKATTENGSSPLMFTIRVPKPNADAWCGYGNKCPVSGQVEVAQHGDTTDLQVESMTYGGNDGQVGCKFSEPMTFSIAGDKRTGTWSQKWGGNACTEYINVYYSVRRKKCLGCP